METHESDHEKMEAMLQKNAALLEENNKILRKMHRYNMVAFWSRLLWYAVLIGMPFAIYFYVLEPYFAVFGTSYDKFVEGLNQLPGLRGIDQLINGSE